MVRTATQSGIELKTSYGPDDVADLSYQDDSGDPGAHPFLRGIYPKMYRNRLWLKSFIVSYATAEETNQAFRQYIANGMTDLRLLCDLPTQSGIDPDHPSAWNSMMCGGVATYALPVYEKMLEGLPLGEAVFELAHAGMSSFLYFYGLLVAMMENRGLDIKRLRGNSINDPVRTKLVYGCPDFPTGIDRRICLDHIEFSIRETPSWRPVAPNGVDPCQSGIRTSGLSLTSQKPLNNAARITLQILSCVLGGVNSLDASSMDEAIGLPSPEARIFNLDAQHIITHEANVPLVADPLGGSYYLEWLTGKMEKEVNAYLDEIASQGGIFACLDSGWLEQVMETCRARTQREKAEGKRLIVGVNAFRPSDEEEGPVNAAIRDVAYKTPTIAMREERVAEARRFKAGRDMRRLQPLTGDLLRATREGSNVQRAVIEAAKAGLTLGECVGVIRLGYGIDYDPFREIEMPDFVREIVER